MTFADLIKSEAADERRGLIGAAALGGIAKALVLVVVNRVIEAEGGADLRAFVLFTLLVVLYVLCARRTYRRTTEIIEAALERLKARLATKIERAELEVVERLGAAEIYDGMTESMTKISDSAAGTVRLLQSVFVTACGAVYLAWLSPEGFGLVVLLIGAGLAIYRQRSIEIRDALERMGEQQRTFFDLLTDLLRGFKETRMSRARGRELREDLVGTAGALRAVTLRGSQLINDNIILADCNLMLVLGGFAFVLPQHVAVTPATLESLVAGLMFVWEPLGGVVEGLPAYLRSDVAYSQIQALEEKLDQALREVVPETEAHDPWGGRLTSIEAEDLEYAYTSHDGGGSFRVGPVSLGVAAGEVVFLVGGNGSGKSTLLKVLTGLYRPSAGGLSVDGTLVRPENVQSYREMISAIHSDFHLFDKLYGLLGVEAAAVHRLIAELGLEGSTSYARQRFTRRDLSTGQRKRLAMIVALLEDRPLYVFDEWAADQDPEYRRHFYEEMLPALRQRGKAVLAVSHDDRYFHCADRVVTMEYGKIRSISRNHAAPPPAAAAVT